MRVNGIYDVAAASVEQLALFACARGQHSDQLAITSEDIQSVESVTPEQNVFALTTAFAQRQLRPALTLLHAQLAAGAHPLYLLTMLRYQVRTLAAVAAARAESPDAASITRRTKLSGFVVRKAQTLLPNFVGRYLGAIYAKLVDADVAIKTSRIDGDVALDLLTVAICK